MYYIIKLTNTNGIYINYNKNLGIGIESAYNFHNKANAMLFVAEFKEKYPIAAKENFEIIQKKIHKNIFEEVI